jgi:23S rRNA pseudouridine1911/1915/1917 synthase
MVKEGSVKINGESEKPSYKLKGDETISLHINESNDNSDHLTAESIPLSIIYEDEAVIGINKPAGLVVHPGVGNRTGTLVNGLIHHFHSLSDINGTMKPGLVHRLDKATSGIMIIAKTNSAHEHIAEQFQKKSIQKKYFGVTWGLWKEREGTINKNIARKKSDPTLFHVDSDKGKPSETGFKVIKKGRYYSLVSFFPKTGRTHQIRVHSKFMGYPIMGDESYGGGMSKIKGFIPEVSKIFSKEIVKLNRHALHAEEIRFQHPLTGLPFSLKAPLATELHHFCTVLDENEL